MYILKKRVQKIKKNNNLTFYTTTLTNVAFEIGIGFELEGCLRPL